ncbi:MAG: carbon monoxide dehydrogenase [Ramlibacter sp.]|jgi:carbon-monoxide dehydrogenase medium subunit|nr:carbon monoxide dehydrogenase [Ramlibacter sp.]
MKAPSFQYHRAASVQHGLELIREFAGTGKFMSGGQTLMPMMNLRLAAAEHLIDVGALPELRETREAGRRAFVGGGVTHAMVEDGKVRDPARGLLAHVAAGIAYRSVRNRGTMGGSLAHADPAADWPCALRALDAVVVIRGADGERELPLADFQRGLMETALGEDELLVGVLLPELSPKARWAYRKFCHKVGEFAHSICAVVHDPELRFANVVLGAAADKPVRLANLCDYLAQGMTAGAVGGAQYAGALRKDLTEAAGLDPTTYDYQLHQTIVTRSLAEALQK